MTPFFFSDADEPLYGVHHEPMEYSHRSEAVLVCHGMGRDYMRTHRGLVLFSEQMAQAGYHVLRFDYYGTGDSHGNDGDGRLERWVDDIAVAGQEIMDLAGVDRLSVIGVRIGASLACQAATDLTIKSLVLWDPVVNGSQYLDELEAFNRSYYSDLNRFPESRSDEIDAGADELVGYVWSKPMRESLSGLDLLKTRDLQIENITAVSSDSGEDYSELEAHFSNQINNVNFVKTEEDPKWHDLTSLGDALVMHKTLAMFKAAVGGEDLV